MILTFPRESRSAVPAYSQFLPPPCECKATGAGQLTPPPPPRGFNMGLRAHRRWIEVDGPGILPARLPGGLDYLGGTAPGRHWEMIEQNPYKIAGTDTAVDPKTGAVLTAPKREAGKVINAQLFEATDYYSPPPLSRSYSAPVNDTAADNALFVVDLTNAWTHEVIAWVLGQLEVKKLKTDTAVGRTNALRARILEIFNTANHDGGPASVRDFTRIALQGAQPLDTANATANLDAAATGNNRTAADRYGWQKHWRLEAHKWMQERQALSWPACVEVFVGLPLVDPPQNVPILQSVQDRTRMRDYFPDSIQPLYGSSEWGELIRWPERFRILDKTMPRPPAGLSKFPEGLGVQGAVVPDYLVAYAREGWRDQLSESNRVACYALVAQLEDATLLQLAGDYGVKSELPRTDKIIGLSEAWATYATEANQSLMVSVARDAVKRGLGTTTSLQSLRTAAAKLSEGLGAGVTGAGGFFSDLARGFKRLVGHVADFFRSVGKAVGRFLQAVGRVVRRIARIPIIGDFFIVATGIELVFGEVLPLIGKLLVTGKVTPSDWESVGFGFSRLLDRAGRALAIVAPFLPPPFNMAAGALAAISIAAGMGIAAVLNAPKIKGQTAAYNKAQDEKFKAEVKAAEESQAQLVAQQMQQMDAVAAEAQDGMLDYLEREGLLADAFYIAAEDDVTPSAPPVALIAGGIAAAVVVGGIIAAVVAKG